MPPHEVRELRALVAHRVRLVKQRTQVRNRLRAVLFRHNLVAPPGEVFSLEHRSWWNELTLPTAEQLRVRHDLTILDCLELLHWDDLCDFLLRLLVDLLDLLTLLFRG